MRPDYEGIWDLKLEIWNLKLAGRYFGSTAQGWVEEAGEKTIKIIGLGEITKDEDIF